MHAFDQFSKVPGESPADLLCHNAGGERRGKTAEERAEAAAAKEREKQEKKAARERAKQEKAAQKYSPAFYQDFSKLDGSAFALRFGYFKSVCGPCARREEDKRKRGQERLDRQRDTGELSVYNRCCS